MAKKTEELSYLQMPLPSGRRHYKLTKRSWTGLNYRQTIDSGDMSMQRNISTAQAPYLVPSPKCEKVYILTDDVNNPIIMGRQHPIGLFGFDDFLIGIYRVNNDVKLDYIVYKAEEHTYGVHTAELQSADENKNKTDEEIEVPRCIVQFNKYIESDDIVNGQYRKKLLIFPDKKSMDFEINGAFVISNLHTPVPIIEYDGEEGEEPPEDADTEYYYQNSTDKLIYGWDEEEEEWKVSTPPSFPNIKYATVHLSRLFGVSDDSVYASGFNDYANWSLDTIDTSNDGNAWCSQAQSNTKADGNFTGIINFQGHVVCFKRDYMHEIYNTKNPFRIQDVYAEGAIDNRTIQDVDGRLIFVSEDDVKIYTGTNPRIIGYNLGLGKYTKAVSGTDGRCYYLYCEDEHSDKRLFVYDTYVDAWSERYIDEEVISFAHNKNGMYMLTKNSEGQSNIYKMDTEDYSHDWSFETDLITSESVDIKHIKKIQMLADLAQDANIKVYILYDDEEFDSDTSHLVYDGEGGGQKAIRVKPRKTASYGIKLHIEGFGFVKLYELELLMEKGGELYA
jgi:hypothetical protein